MDWNKEGINRVLAGPRVTHNRFKMAYLHVETEIKRTSALQDWWHQEQCSTRRSVHRQHCQEGNLWEGS